VRQPARRHAAATPFSPLPFAAALPPFSPPYRPFFAPPRPSIVSPMLVDIFLADATPAAAAPFHVAAAADAPGGDTLPPQRSARYYARYADGVR
jgi:hypothetical protein